MSVHRPKVDLAAAHAQSGHGDDLTVPEIHTRPLMVLV